MRGCFLGCAAWIVPAFVCLAGDGLTSAPKTAQGIETGGFRLGAAVLLDSSNVPFIALSTLSSGHFETTRLERYVLARAVLDSKGKPILASDGSIIISVDGTIGSIPVKVYRKSKPLPPVSAGEEREAAHVADLQSSADWRKAHMFALKEIDRGSVKLENSAIPAVSPGQHYAVYRIDWDFKKSGGFFIRYRALKVGDVVVDHVSAEDVSGSYKGLPIRPSDIGAHGYVYSVFVP